MATTPVTVKIRVSKPEPQVLVDFEDEGLRFGGRAILPAADEFARHRGLAGILRGDDHAIAQRAAVDRLAFGHVLGLRLADGQHRIRVSGAFPFVACSSGVVQVEHECLVAVEVVDALPLA